MDGLTALIVTVVTVLVLAGAANVAVLYNERAIHADELLHAKRVAYQEGRIDGQEACFMGWGADGLTAPIEDWK